jgi:6-phosphofructokinase 2
MSETETGDQYRFVMPGQGLDSEEWRACAGIFTDLQPPPGYVVASGSLPPGVPEDFYLRVGRNAREVGARFVLDTSGPGLRAALEAGGIYLVKPNLRELRDLTGRTLKDRSSQEDAARALVEKEACEIVALTLGAEGAILAWKGGCQWTPAPQVEMRSAIGAGDSFLAGMTLRLAEDWDISQAFRFGMACGAAALMTPATDLCHRRDAERLYESMAAAA